jgi:hypothetical protein
MHAGDDLNSLPAIHDKQNTPGQQNPVSTHVSGRKMVHHRHLQQLPYACGTVSHTLQRMNM